MAETENELARSWRANVAPADRRPIYDWGHDYVVLPKSYAVDGVFNVGISRQLIGPFDAIRSEDVREETIIASIQGGKTLVLDIAIPWIITNAPGPIMWTWQSEPDGKEHCYTRLMAWVKECGPVRNILPSSRYATQTAAIYFGDFWFLVNGANKNSLQGKSVRWKLNSEVWLWDQGLLQHARNRVSAFERYGTSKIINESQAGPQESAPKTTHDLYATWLESSQCVWSVPCEACGAVVPLEFFDRIDGDSEKRAGVVWNDDAKNADGTWNHSRAAETARFRCRKCGHDHADSAKTRARFNDLGLYVQQNKAAPIAKSGHRWNQVLTHALGPLVDEWLTCSEQLKRGVTIRAQDFYQQKLAMFWKNQQEQETITLKPTAYTLAELSTDLAKRIEGEVYRFATMDRQRDHRWLLVRAWRADASSRLLFAGRVSTKENAKEICDAYGVEPQLCFEDAQFETGHVYDECAQYGWVALHGSGDHWFTWDIEDGKKERRLYSRVSDVVAPCGGMACYVYWASDPIKDMLASLRDGKGAAFEYPPDVSKEWIQHMTGEVKRVRINKGTGQEEERWTKIGQNHLWDCEAMGVAAACMLKIFQL